MPERRRPAGPDDLVGLGLALGVLAPRRRRSRPTSQVMREAALHAVVGAAVLGLLFFAALVIMELS